MPLSNNNIGNRIDEVSKDDKAQLVENLISRKISIQLDESTVRASEAVLLTYVRYIDNGEFAKAMLFCGSLAAPILPYNKLKIYLDENQILMENIVSCAADGARKMAL